MTDSADELIQGRETLPFFDKKQDALLGYLLVDESFFLQARHRIKPEWFLNSNNTHVLQAALDFFEKYKRKPSEAELRQSFAFLKADQGARTKMNAQINIAKIAMKEYGLDVLRKELTLWMRSRIFKEEVERAYVHFNNSASKASKDPENEFGQAFSTLKKAAIDIELTSFESENAVDFDDVASGAFFDVRQVELQGALTFGCDMIDRKLNADCINGSLLRGDHTVLLAPTNVGKTTTMITTIVENIRRKHSVLFLTHEGRSDDIKAKILMAFTNKTYGGLLDLTRTPEGQANLSLASKFIREFLTYIPINKAGIVVEDVEAVIRRQQEKRIATHGKGFDLIVDDYPAKLWTREAGKGWARRQVDEFIYNYFTQTGLEFKAHVLTAIQTNREGSKVNEGRKGAEERLLGMEDVAESFPVMATATNVLSLNRDALARARNRMTFHICKSRSNDTGWSIVSQTDFSRGRTHGSNLLTTVYRGMSPMTDTIDELLRQHAGVAIPEQYYLV